MNSGLDGERTLAMAASAPDPGMLCLSQGHPKRHCSRYHAQWADLPADLLAKISKLLHDPLDITRFRSVCRSWRSSRPSNSTISPHFPHAFTACLDPTQAFCGTREPKHVIANAVYFVRDRSDPLKSCLVSVEESIDGRFLRHAITGQAMHHYSRLSLDLSRCVLTRIAISHRILFVGGQVCSRCDHSASQPRKVVFATPDSDPDPVNDHKGLTNPKLMEVCRYKQGGLCAFRLNANGLGHQTRHLPGLTEDVRDFVNFNGRVYAVDLCKGTANVYMFDCLSSLQLVPLTCLDPPFEGTLFGIRFVVSDGDLYMFCDISSRLNNKLWPRFVIYKLVFEENVNCYRLQRVQDLGDRVFFVTINSSFSIPAQDLPPGLEPNCVIFSRHAFMSCLYERDLDFTVCRVGAWGWESYYSNVYRAWFTPPESLLKLSA